MNDYDNQQPSKKDVEFAKTFIHQGASEVLIANSTIKIGLRRNESYESYWERCREQASKEFTLDKDNG